VPAPLGLGRYAWGGERLRVARLEVSPSLVGAPLVLVARDGGAFELREGGAVLVAGTAGTPASGGGGERSVSLLVSELVARPGTEFVVKQLDTDELVDGLRRALEVSEQGKAGGLAEVKLAGSDPARTARIVEELAAAYVRDSQTRAAAEAASTLRTLEERLPGLRAEVDAAELALTRFYQRNGKVNLSVDGARLLARINELEHAITAADLAETEQQRRHTGSYPELAAPADAARSLREQRAGVEAQIAALPGLELELARLTRQVAFARERHVRTLNRAEELRTAQASWIGNARIMEHAVVPHRPVKPKPPLVMVVALLLGLGGGVAAAFVRSAFDGGVRDPAELEAQARVPVLATIPRSRTQRRIARAPRGARLEPLAVVDPADAAVEELRALRTGVEVALARAENHVVTLGSAGPGAGKSFVTVNLAHLLAAPDGHVLVVDADLRRGVLHRYFGVEVGPGLSDVLSGKIPLDAALRRTDHPKIDLLTSGARVTNPAELLAGDGLRRLLAEAAGRYSVVVVDTPPILSVTDGALVARHAAVNLLVVRSGAQTPREISLAVQRLVRTGIAVRGAVLNDVQPTLGRYGRSGRYRRYDTHPA
jgi:tyrosine-protein kinase Etk/Wzc